MAKHAEIILDGKSYKFPLVEGSEGEIGIDISNLMEETGAVTLDFGYKNTGATKSAITFLDGDKGILRYRGYSIEDLAAKSNFLEVSYLLIFGELPTSEQLDKFSADIKNHTMVHEDIKKILDGFPSTSHP
ncbi:MAG TPA: citrate/2-methylcitrate synthase, partial [Cyclobacteriaceae bacterium]|nr:citrate/2-methylcitrate synthase [Cyclobacteriaceae bacterium]